METEDQEVDDLEQRVRAFVHEQELLPLDIDPSTDILDKAGICGDDLWELVDKFASQFSVRMEGFRWYHHSGPEGCNPFWLVLKPWWARKTHVPIRLTDLIASARAGEWSVQYPASEAEPVETEEDRYHTRLGCAVMAGGAIVITFIILLFRQIPQISK